MAGRLLTCRRCRQAILSDARCCPHCAVARPIRGKTIRNLALGAMAIATLGIGLKREREIAPQAVSARPAAAAATARTLIEGSGLAPLSAPPDAVSTACLSRGGTIVHVLGTEGSMARRCAVEFDDGGSR